MIPAGVLQISGHLNRRMAQFLRLPGIGQVSAYALAIFTVSGANFLSVPLLISLFGRERFSTWSLLEPLFFLAVPASLVGTQFSVLRRISADRMTASDAVSEILPPISYSILLLAIVASGATYFSAVPGAAAPTFLIVVSEAFILLACSAWRAEGRARTYAAVEGARAVSLLLGLCVVKYGLHSSHFRVDEYLWMRAASALLALPVVWLTIQPRRVARNPALMKAVWYGGPIVVASALQVLLQNVDRYVVSTVANHASVTVYVAHLKIASLVTAAINGPFYAWYAPEAIRRGAAPVENARFMSGICIIFLGLLLLAGANLVLVCQAFWSAIFPSVPYSFSLLVALTASCVLISLVSVVGVGTLQPGLTVWATIGVASGALLVFVSSLFLGKAYGLYGVAIARIAGMFGYMMVVFAVSRRSLRLQFPITQLLLMVIVTALAGWAAVRMFEVFGLAAWLGIAISFNATLAVSFLYLYKRWRAIAVIEVQHG